MPIDWSKPLRTRNGHRPARLVHTMRGSAYPRVVVEEFSEGLERCGSYAEDTHIFENVPERREWWANIYRSPSGHICVGGTYNTEVEARAAGLPNSPLACVLVYVDNDDNPPLQLAVGKRYRTRGGAITVIDRYDPHYTIDGVQFPFIDESGFSYRGDGTYTPGRAPHSFDIIAELP